MTRVTTSLLMIGPKFVGSWADRAWRLNLCAQMVEGSVPYWIVTPTQPAQHPVFPSEIEVSSPHADSVVESILFLVASHLGDEGVEENLVETHNLHVDILGRRELARFYELSEHSQSFLANRMSQQVRLGLTQLDDLSLVNDEVIQRLRQLDFDVEVFRS